MRFLSFLLGQLPVLSTTVFIVITGTYPAAVQAQCDPRVSCCATPPGTGSPCGGASVASLSSTGGPSVAAGNPLHLLSGNKYQEAIDLPALSGELGLEVIRYYNSHTSGPSSPGGLLGRGWRLSYDTRLRPSSDRQQVQVDQADGGLLQFQVSHPNAPRYLPQDRHSQGWIERTTGSGGVHWRWHWPEGRRLDFNAQGQLVQIVAASGAFLSIERDPQGWPVRITDPQGRSLRFHYQRTQATGSHPQYRGLQAIDTPVGRIDYTYADSADPVQRANLVRAQGPQADWRYHHEDPQHPTLLTGISQGSQRLSRYTYDSEGRAVRSQREDQPERNIEMTSHRRPQGSQAGRVQLRNAQGQTTEIEYRVIQGQYRLTQMRGAGCPDCGPSPRRYDWDAQGRLVAEHQLDEQGRILASQRWQRDGQGRLIRQWQERQGQVQHSLQLYYASEDSTEPSRIERPSVVAGRTHQLEIRYNERGQVTQVTERGWRPAVGQDSAPTALERTTTYRYQNIQGVSMLTHIDGPLPNGPQQSPQDSDITTFEYSPQTRQVSVLTQPGGAQHRITYDNAGRIVHVINEAGFYTAWRHNAHNQPTHIAQGGPGWKQPLLQVLHYDAQGRLIETGTSQLLAQHISKPETLAQVDAQRLQDWHQSHYRAHWKQAFDAADRLLWHADARGFLTQYRYNEQGQWLETRLSSSRFQYTQRYDYTPQGQPWRIQDNAGREVSVAAKPPTAPQAPTGAKRLQDDWGRLVAVDHPGTGRTLYTYNLSDQMIGMQDSQGHQAQYRYDLAGRIVEQIIRPHSGPATTTRWHYAGRQLIALEHPTQSERYQYDERGLRTARLVILPRGSGQSPIISRTGYEYDPQGQLIATQLPDGSRVFYERNGQGQVVALKRNTVQTPWLRWLAADQVLVQDLQRDLYGLAHYQTGNGLTTEWQRSTAGDLARLVHRRPPPKTTQTAQHPYTHDLLSLLLGLSPAYAQTTQSPPSTEPGALGLASDPQALVDYRYLWDARGNLLLNPVRRLGNSSVEHNAYAYNRQEQLVVALRQTSSPQAADRTAVQEQLWRYAYDGQQRRVLQQHTQRQDDLQQGTQRLNYVAGSAQLTGTAYDTAGQPTRQGERHYQWDALGRLMQIDVEGQGQTQRQRLAEYRYDHRGLRNRKTTAQEDTHYLYDDSRQLQGEVNAQGRLQRQYVYLADQPLVVIDSTDPGVDLTQAASESVWRQVQDDLQRLWRQWQDRDRLSWLHLNHLGAPEAATNAAGEVIWQLSTGPFGETLQVLAQDGLNVHLRLPGQYWDAESGLHYNRARYYDPAQGAYLSPDPLHDGDTWPDGPNPYAYVAYNPLKYVDPDGLILFAFDGTGNSDRRDDPAMAGNGLSNVVRFRDAYNDGRARYITGVGTVHVDSRYGNIVPDTYAQGKLIDWLTPDTPLFYNDMGGNYSGAARIDRMMLYMRDEADAFDDKEVMDIDIIGFSRGAAQARDFANRITSRTFRQNGKTYYRYQTGTGQTRCQAVNFRFMGLFDTVLSTNFSGYTYRMGIPSAFQYVAQAVALNEYRSDSMAQWTERNPQNYNQHFGGFPLESIGASRNTPGQVRIERGFIGAHADIGGGYADGENQLSLVALNWMVAQAQVAGVKMRQLPRNQQLPTGNPVLHDQSNAMNLGDPRTTQNLGNRPPYTVIRAEDREVRGAVSGRTQRTMGFGAAEAGGNRSMINRDTHQFIAYKPRDVNQLNEGTALDPSTMANRTGTVDMAGYLNWLRQHGYVFPQDY